MFAILMFAFCAAMTGLNVALYVAVSNPLNLGAAVICGLCAVANLAMAVNS